MFPGYWLDRNGDPHQRPGPARSHLSKMSWRSVISFPAPPPFFFPNLDEAYIFSSALFQISSCKDRAAFNGNSLIQQLAMGQVDIEHDPSIRSCSETPRGRERESGLSFVGGFYSCCFDQRLLRCHCEWDGGGQPKSVFLQAIAQPSQEHPGQAGWRPTHTEQLTSSRLTSPPSFSASVCTLSARLEISKRIFLS